MLASAAAILIINPPVFSQTTPEESLRDTANAYTDSLNPVLSDTSAGSIEKRAMKERRLPILEFILVLSVVTIVFIAAVVLYLSRRKVKSRLETPGSTEFEILTSPIDKSNIMELKTTLPPWERPDYKEDKSN